MHIRIFSVHHDGLFCCPWILGVSANEHHWLHYLHAANLQQLSFLLRVLFLTRLNPLTPAFFAWRGYRRGKEKKFNLFVYNGYHRYRYSFEPDGLYGLRLIMLLCNCPWKQPASPCLFHLPAQCLSHQPSEQASWRHHSHRHRRRRCCTCSHAISPKEAPQFGWSDQAC